LDELNRILHSLGFSIDYLVAGRSTIADLFSASNKRCGVYVLYFHNGDCYVGQARNVVRRFAEHRRRWNDIKEIKFQTLKPDFLNSIEQNSILTLENAGFSVRNIQYAAIPHIETDFDLIMSLEQQQMWHENLNWVDIEGDRLQNEPIRMRYREKYNQLMMMPFADEIKQILRNYVRSCVPAIKRAEVAHWVCTCLPSKIVYSRVNCGMQVVFQIGVKEQKIIANFHMSRESANLLASKPLKASEDRIDTQICGAPAAIIRNDLSSGGLDQVQISVRHPENIYRILNDSRQLQIARSFNLQLMRKRTSGWQRNHCLDLADCIYD